MLRVPGIELWLSACKTSKHLSVTSLQSQEVGTIESRRWLPNALPLQVWSWQPCVWQSYDLLHQKCVWALHLDGATLINGMCMRTRSEEHKPCLAYICMITTVKVSEQYNLRCHFTQCPHKYQDQACTEPHHCSSNRGKWGGGGGNIATRDEKW